MFRCTMGIAQQVHKMKQVSFSCGDQDTHQN